jgi:hypothetical protein
MLKEIFGQYLTVNGDVSCGSLSVAELSVAGAIQQNPVRLGDASTGTVNQGSNSVAIGAGAGVLNQGENCIAVGTNVGVSNQGEGAIAIGVTAGVTSQHPYSICINADTNTILDSTQSSSLFINPVRGLSADQLAASAPLYYNPTSGEIVYLISP